jgi:hypothetical protein
MEEIQALPLAEMQIEPRLPAQRRAASADGGSGDDSSNDKPTETTLKSEIILPSVAPEEKGEMKVLFNNDQNFDGAGDIGRAFFSPSLKRQFTWEIASSSIRFTKVEWVVKAVEDYQKDYIVPQSSSNYDDRRRANEPGFYTVSSDRDQDRFTAILDLPKFQNELSGNNSAPMIMRVHWENKQLVGQTWSGVFTVVNDTKVRDTWYHDESEKGGWGDEERFGGENFDRKQLWDHSSSTTSTQPQATQTTKPTESSSADSSAGGGELSTGAIAGIAVGGAAAVIILITAIFFLYRRRHRKRLAADRAGYDGQRGATTYFTDKENSRVPDTPQTPYSEDGAHRLPPSSVPGLALTHDDIEPSPRQPPSSNVTDGNSTFVPYKNPDPATSRTDLATRSGTALSSNIAHLVEDGMTDDEIRRLEEEERQLDDAIAQARRR